MIRLGLIVGLASLLMAAPSHGQVRLDDVRGAQFPSWSLAAVSPDSDLPRLTLVTRSEPAAEPRHKSPVLAWFLSWLIPGGGQAYNGQWTKAAAFFGVAAAGFAVVAANDGFDCTSDCGARDLGLGILVISSIGSQIEAPIAASKINREAREAAAPR
jgi:hypothetical protein